MKFHIFRKELCPSKYSVCRVCHWVNSLMFPRNPKKKCWAITKRKQTRFLSSFASLQSISPTAESQTSPTASVKTIAISPVTSVESHCHADYVIGNHNWIQRCMIDPGGNINCVGYK